MTPETEPPPVNSRAAAPPSTAPRLVLREALRELLLDLLALVWPLACVACGAPDRGCCAACSAALRMKRGRAFAVRAPAGVLVWAAGGYTGALRALVVGCKHAGLTGLAGELGAQLRGPLAAALRCARSPGRPPRPVSPVLIVTAPSSAARLRERGYHHVELIVRSALRGPPLIPGEPRPWLLRRALRARRGRRSQQGLRPAERRRNAALVDVRPRVRARLRGRAVLFVDDVCTTGATAAAACAALTAAGARVIGVVVLCAVERRDAPSRETRGEWNRHGRLE